MKYFLKDSGFSWLWKVELQVEFCSCFYDRLVDARRYGMNQSGRTDIVIGGGINTMR